MTDRQKDRTNFLGLLKKLPKNRLWGPSSSEVGFTIEVGKRQAHRNIRGKRVWRGEWSLAAWCDWDFKIANSQLISSGERKLHRLHAEFESKINRFLKNQIIRSADFDDGNRNLSIMTSGGYNLRFLPKRNDDWTIFVHGKRGEVSNDYYSAERKGIISKKSFERMKNRRIRKSAT